MGHGAASSAGGVHPLWRAMLETYCEKKLDCAVFDFGRRRDGNLLVCWKRTGTKRIATRLDGAVDPTVFLFSFTLSVAAA